MASRSSESQREHDRWIQLVAMEHFGFPNDFQPNWETITNPGEDRNIGIVLKSRDVVCPDIVVRNRVAGPGVADAMLIAEIETAETVVESEVEQWRQFASADPGFYLYVPQGSGKKALKLTEGIRMRGVYEYYEGRDGKTHFDLIV